jgi:HEAT repeat protein
VEIQQDTSALERAAAACGLGKAGNETAVPALIAMLDDGAPLPPQIFCGTQPPFEDESWSPKYPGVFEPSPGEAAARALVAIGDSAVGPLTDTLRAAPHWRARKNAAWALGYRGRPADALVNALHDPDWQVRAQVAHSLMQIRGNDRLVGAALSSTLTDVDWRVREQATAAIGARGPRADATRALLIALQDAEPRVRTAATAGLWHSADAQAWDALFLALADADENVRAGASRALGNRAMDAEVQRLIAALEDPDVRIRQGVRDALRIVDQRMRGTTTNLTRIQLPLD